MNPLTLPAVAEASQLGVNTIFTYPENISPDMAAALNKAGLGVCLVKNLFEGERWWDKYPDSQPVNKEGKLMDKVDWYAGVCPTHPHVREDLLKELNGLLGREDLAGISLNFLRFPAYWENVRKRSDLNEGCYCKRCVATYQKSFDAPPEGPSWAMWKAAQITGFAMEIAQLNKNKGRLNSLGLHLVPWTTTEFHSARPEALGQDLNQLKDSFDYISPMCHWGLLEKPVTWLNDTVAWVKAETDKAVVPIVQGFAVEDGLFAEAMIEATVSPSDGAIVFYWEELEASEAKKNALKANYRPQ